MKPQPLISVRDVEASSRWYQSVLGLESGHGGTDYERLLRNGQMVMQLHHWEPEEHPHLGSPDRLPIGNGVALWFQTDSFDDALQRIDKQRQAIIEGPRVNTNANHREVWLRDPDGYVVVVAGSYGDV